MENAKKIEAKTIRDGIHDMKDSLERIGKRIQRAARNVQQVQEEFHKSAGNVLKVLSKIKKRTALLHLHDDILEEDEDDPLLLSSKSKSPRTVSFMNDDNDKRKWRKFRIVDPGYLGTWIVRDRVPRDHDDVIHDEESAMDTFYRQETVLKTDRDFAKKLNLNQMNGFGDSEDMEGLHLVKTRMKKVRIRRMRRLKRKEDGPVSRKTAKTIRRLRELKKVCFLE